MAVHLPGASSESRQTRLSKLFGIERLSPYEELVEKHTERVHVGPRIDIEIRHLGLLWTHVLRRSNKLAEFRVDGVLRQSLRGRLATPKSMIFGTGLSFCTVTRTFDGLMSR